MATDRQPGSDRGRPLIDWEQAFSVYAALPPERRSYQSIADEFGVSVRTVERHGRKERWRQRARRIDVDAAHQAEQLIGKARADQLADVQKLIEATLISYAQQLRDGTVRLSASDLPRLFKLGNELYDASDYPDPPTDTAPARPAAGPSVEHMVAVLAALHESGALAALTQPNTEADT